MAIRSVGRTLLYDLSAVCATQSPGGNSQMWVQLKVLRIPVHWEFSCVLLTQWQWLRVRVNGGCYHFLCQAVGPKPYRAVCHDRKPLMDNPCVSWLAQKDTQNITFFFFYINWYVFKYVWVLKLRSLKWKRGRFIIIGYRKRFQLISDLWGILYIDLKQRFSNYGSRPKLGSQGGVFGVAHWRPKQLWIYFNQETFKKCRLLRPEWCERSDTPLPRTHAHTHTHTRTRTRTHTHTHTCVQVV